MIWQTKKVQIDSADIQWDGSEETLAVIREFVNDDSLLEVTYIDERMISLRIWNDLEIQWLNVPIGHWVVKGLRGEFYPCEPKAMDKKYFEYEEGDEVNLVDLIQGLKSVGESLSGSYYIKESDMVDMGEYLQTIADKLEKFGVK
jgi:hypothetical protein